MLRWRLILASVVLSLVVTAEEILPGSLKDLARFRKPAVENRMVVPGFLWVEAEDFDDYGEWRLDTQFVHKMGSAYLLAGGVGTPIRDAVTTVELSRGGNYRIWVRTRNWLAGYAPGRFSIAVNGKRSGRVLGEAEPEVWVWESAGEFELDAGKLELALVDLSGAFARCDAVLLTSDLAYKPPVEPEALERERKRLTGFDPAVKELGEFDVVVIGAGAAGCSAAVAAARTGARTALVHDRPILGGNSSSELGVGLDGASRHDNAREGGITEEANMIRVRKGLPRMSEAYHIQTAAETNLSVFSNSRVMGVEMEDGKIGAVRVVDTLTLAPARVAGRVFIDCSGDGWVGYYAGAEYRFGREARSEFGEPAAPLEADELTMSGCIMGNNSLSYKIEDRGRAVEYTPPEWAVKLPPPEEFGRVPRGLGGQWWLENPGKFNDLEDPERARDELIRISFAYWGWVKSGWSERARARNYAMTYVPHMDARRETRRLVGDYILKQQDCEAGRLFPDRVAYGGWSLDLHHPLGIHSGKEGPYYFDGYVPIYSIPYRSIYSKNIPNLLMAGRCMSVTHVALGTVRVQATLATVGQAAGTAAALCVRHGVLPRELGESRIGELQQQLLKDDQYIPGVVNQDSADLARKAKVTASSTSTFVELGGAGIKTSDRHPLNMFRAVMFPRGMLERVDSINLCLYSERDEAVEITAHLCGADELGGFDTGREIVAASAVVPAGKRSFVKFKVDAKVTQPYIWVWLPATEGVHWMRLAERVYQGSRAYRGSMKGKWTLARDNQYAFYTEPSLKIASSFDAQHVVDGVTRIVGFDTHLWVSDPDVALPQWIKLEWPEPVEINEVRLTFDTNFNRRDPMGPVPPELVKSYQVEAFDGSRWQEVAVERENVMRLRSHIFERVRCSQLRVRIISTHGAPSARIFEIRAYNNKQ